MRQKHCAIRPHVPAGLGFRQGQAEIEAKEKDAGPSLWFNGRDITKPPSPLGAADTEPVVVETVPDDGAVIGASSS
jgi:hypothetical protein